MNNFSKNVEDSGAWGPIVIKATDPSNKYFLSQIENPDEKIEIKIRQEKNQLFLYPIFPLKIGEAYQLNLEGNSEPILKEISIRKPCLVYLNDPGGKSDLWKKCPGQEPEALTKIDEKIEDFTVARTGEWIFFSTTNDTKGSDIWKMTPDGKVKERIFDCEESKCLDLDYSPLTSQLVFNQINKKAQIKVLDLITGKEIDLEGSGSELRFSPNGQYLSYLDNLTEKMTIIDLATMGRDYLSIWRRFDGRMGKRQPFNPFWYFGLLGRYPWSKSI